MKFSAEENYGQRSRITQILSFLVAFILITLLVLPTLYSFNRKSSNSLGIYKGYEVSANPYGLYAKTLQEENIMRNYGIFSPYDPFTKVAIKLELISLARKADIVNIPIEVDKQLLSDPMFFSDFDKDYKFDRAKFENTAENVKFNLRKTAEQNLLYNRVSSDLYSFLDVSSPEMTFYGDIARKVRDFRVVKFEDQLYPNELIIKYFKEHEQDFRRMTLRSITAQNEEDIKEIKSKLNKGEDFALLAKQFSKDEYKESGGLLGEVYEYNLKSSLKNEDIDKIFALAQNEVSMPIKVDSSTYKIFKAESSYSSLNLESQDSIKIVKDRILAVDRGIVESYFEGVSKAFVENAKKVSLAVAAENAKLEVQFLKDINLNYGNVYFLRSGDYDYSKSVYFNSKDFLLKAFSLKAGEVSDPILVAGTYVVFELDQERELEYKQEKKIEIENVLKQGFETDVFTTYVDKTKIKKSKGIS